MKKICFITTVSLTLKTFVLKTAKYLHDNTDWDISFICSYDEEFSKSLPDYIHFYPVKMERGISIAGIKATVNIYKIFKREKFDLIQYSTPNASLYASLAGKLSKIKVKLYCQWGLAFVGFNGIKRKIFRMEEKFVCSLSDYIEPDSKSNLDFCHKERIYPKQKGKVIWNGSACGVDLHKFDFRSRESFRKEIRNKYSIPEDAFIYGFVGRVTRDKGINELLQSFVYLLEEHKDMYLFIVGPNEVDESVDKELYNYSVKSDKIIYTGYTNKVEEYLSAMDCYVLASYREGFGMGVVEAEAMGIPVIVSNIPGPIDAMQENITGLIVQKADAESLKSAMKKMYESRTTLDIYGENGIKYAKENFEQQELFKHILSDRKELLANMNEQE